MALSIAKTKFISSIKAAKEALWLQGLMEDLVFHLGPTKLFCDSQSTIHLMKTPIFHNKSKHID